MTPDAVVARYEPVARCLALHFRHACRKSGVIDQDDLVAEAMVTLIRALPEHDPTRCPEKVFAIGVARRSMTRTLEKYVRRMQKQTDKIPLLLTPEDEEALAYDDDGPATVDGLELIAKAQQGLSATRLRLLAAVLAGEGQSAWGIRNGITRQAGCWHYRKMIGHMRRRLGEDVA